MTFLALPRSIKLQVKRARELFHLADYSIVDCVVTNSTVVITAEIRRFDEVYERVEFTLSADDTRVNRLRLASFPFVVFPYPSN